GLTGGGCSGAGACTVTISGATAVTATFDLPTFALTVTKAGTGTGTVTSTPAGITCGATCAGNYASGAVVTLMATPTADSTFTGWSGGGCSGTGACTVTVSAATTVAATFDVPTFALTVTKAGTGSGTVTSTPAGIACEANCTTNFTSGTAVTLTAIPDSGSIFSGWSGGGCSGTAACTVTISGATAVTATFDVPTFALTVTKGGTGSGTVTSEPAGITCGAGGAASYASGTADT